MEFTDYSEPQGVKFENPFEKFLPKLLIGPASVTWVQLMHKPSTFTSTGTFYQMIVTGKKVEGTDTHIGSGVKKFYSGSLKNHFLKVHVKYTNGQEGNYTAIVNPEKTDVLVTLKVSKGTVYNSLQGDIAEISGPCGFFELPDLRIPFLAANTKVGDLLLLGRNFCKDCPFHKDVLPLDLFKIICFMAQAPSKLHLSRRIEKIIQKMPQISQSAKEIEQAFMQVKLGGTCDERAFCSEEVKQRAKLMEFLINGTHKDLLQCSATLEDTPALLKEAMDQFLQVQKKIEKTQIIERQAFMGELQTKEKQVRTLIFDTEGKIEHFYDMVEEQKGYMQRFHKYAQMDSDDDLSDQEK